MLVLFGRMRFAFDGVSAATQLVDDTTKAMADPADQFFGRVASSVHQDGGELFRLGDTLIEGGSTSRHRQKLGINDGRWESGC